MQRFAVIAALLLPCAFGQAQTSIKITMPDTSSCTYPTGQISSNSTPGQLQTTATGPGSGTGCFTGPSAAPVSFGPATPLSPNPVTLQSPQTGGVATGFSFAAFNATNCTGSISGGAVFTGGTNTITFCSLTSTSCAAPQTLSATFPNNVGSTDNLYTVAASCTGPGSLVPVTSQAAVTVKPFVQGQSACATIASSGSGTFTPLTGNVNLQYSGHPTASVNIQDFASIYHGTVWPATPGWIALFNVPSNKYVSAAFTPPANYFTASNAPANLYGEYYFNATSATAPLSMTISTSCGDFSPPGSPGSTVVAGCYGNMITQDHIAVFWQNAGPGHTCVLAGSQHYFLNIINADITNVTASGGTATPSCTSTSCIDPISNGPGSFIGYTPN